MTEEVEPNDEGWEPGPIQHSILCLLPKFQGFFVKPGPTNPLLTGADHTDGAAL